jgi:hypothetical protein
MKVIKFRKKLEAKIVTNAMNPFLEALAKHFGVPFFKVEGEVTDMIRQAKVHMFKEIQGQNFLINGDGTMTPISLPIAFFTIEDYVEPVEVKVEEVPEESAPETVEEVKEEVVEDKKPAPKKRRGRKPKNAPKA